jgi:prefoldin subunit 5
VVVHLREVHAELQRIAGKLDGLDRRFDQLDKASSSFRSVVEHTLGLATVQQIEQGRLETRQRAADAWQRGVNDRLEQIERRLAKVEQKLAP